MAIRFLCRNCRQLLAIGSRKAGNDIDCPKCGHRQMVPTPGQDQVLPPPQETGTDAPPESDPADEFTQAVLSELEALRVPPPAVDLFSPPGPLTAPPPRGGVPPDMMLVRRRMVHLQAAFFLVLAGVAFGLGYWLGQQKAALPGAGAVAAQAAADPSLIEGQVIYIDESGRVLGDMGAVVIAVPEGNPPRQPLALTALDADPAPPDPKRPSNPDRRKSIEQIRQLGGAFARVERKGSYSLVLRPGTYRVLIVSAHARRPAGAPVDEADLAELRRVFVAPERFIGTMKYAWGLHPMSPGASGPDQDFGRDEGQPK